MDLPATLNIDPERKAALIRLVQSEAAKLPDDHAEAGFYAGCFHALHTFGDGKIPTTTDDDPKDNFWDGVRLIINFVRPSSNAEEAHSSSGKAHPSGPLTL